MYPDRVRLSGGWSCDPMSGRCAPALIMKLTKTITALAAAFVVVLGGASASYAADDYTPEITGGPTTIAAGGSGTFTFTDFVPNEPVTFTLTGENGAGASLAAVAAITSATLVKNADAAGNVSVTVTLPANASGTYTLTAAGANGAPSTTFSVPASAGLGATGADISPIMLWGVVGIVGLGVIALIAVSAVRRSRRADSVDAG